MMQQDPADGFMGVLATPRLPVDGGFSGGSSQVTALQDVNAQRLSTFGWTSAQACAREGFSG